MLYDTLLEQIKKLAPDIETIKTYWNNSNAEVEYAKLKKISEQEAFWQHPQQAEMSQELQKIKTSRDQYLETVNSFQELQELISLFKDDEKELEKVSQDLSKLTYMVQKFKIALLLNDPQDNAACFFTVNSGAGGTESQDWAGMLVRMYLRFCEREKLTAQIIDYQQGEEAGIKSATLHIKGKKAHGLLKGEAGVHRLVRISPFDSSKRRHTSFAAVSATPEVPEVKITIDQKDLRVDTYRASGAGGQHVNKTDSAVRITHIPSGIVVQCQNERSQIQNRETALKMLKARLNQKQKDEQDKERASIEKKKIEWGSQIRSYVLHPYKMVKDHRTGTESQQPDLVLDGALTPFIESYLMQSGTQTT